jgi:hypothetical protein
MACDEDKAPSPIITIPSIMIPEEAGSELRLALSKGSGESETHSKAVLLVAFDLDSKTGLRQATKSR